MSQLLCSASKIKAVKAAAIQFGNNAVVRACELAELTDDEYAHKVVQRYFEYWNLTLDGRGQ